MDQAIGGTPDAPPAAVQHVRINHRGANIVVAQQLLDGANIVATGQQMRGEGVTKRMTRNALRQACFSNGLFDRPLNQRFIDVMTPLVSRLGVPPAALLRKDELPPPFPIGVRVLAGQRVRQLDAAISVRHVLPVNRLDSVKVFLQGSNHSLRQHGHPVFIPLAFADRDLAALEVEIFDPQPQRFQQP